MAAMAAMAAARPRGRAVAVRLVERDDRRRGLSAHEARLLHLLLLEARGDDRDAHLALHGRLAHCAEDDLALLAHRFLHDVGDRVHIAERHLVAAGDVDQHTARPGDRHAVEQRTLDRHLGGVHRAILAAADAGAHDRRATVLHDGAHVGEVDVHDAGLRDDARDAAGRLQEDLVGLLERILERDPLADHREESLVGHDDHGVDELRHLGDAFVGLAHALATFEEERLGDDADGERTGLARDLADDRCGAGSGATAHAARHEHEVGASNGPRHLVAVLLDRLTPDFRASAGAESPRELLADLDLHVTLGGEQRLRIGVHRDELDAREVLLDHAVDGIATAAADTDDLHARVLRRGVLEFEDAHRGWCSIGRA